MFNKLVAGLAAVAIAGGLALVPAVSASADDLGEGVPPQALPGCAMPGAAGGWTMRTFITKGTNSNIGNREVRPRSLVLGEPCLRDGKIAVPVRVSEIPVEGFDPMEEGNEWSPVPGSTGKCDKQVDVDRTWPSASLMDPDDFPVDCNQIQLAFTTGPDALKRAPDGYKTVELAPVDGSPRVLRVTWEGSLPTSSNTMGGRLEVECGNASTMTVTNRQAWVTTWSATPPPSPVNITCASGTVPLMAFWTMRVENETPYVGDGRFGVLWRIDNRELEGTDGGYVRSYAPSRAHIGDVPLPFNTQPDPYFGCSTGRTSTTDRLVPIDSMYTAGSPLLNDGSNEYEIGLPSYQPSTTPGEFVLSWDRRYDMWLGTTATPTECKYLREIRLTVCVYVDSTATGAICHQTQWTYAQYRNQQHYNEPQTPLGEMCDVAPEGFNNDCFEERYVLPPDYGTLEGACKDPPEPTLLNLDWVVPSVGFWSECLFIPKGGWDYAKAPGGNGTLGPVAVQWAQSGIGDIGDVAVSTVNGFSWGESCGVVLDLSGNAFVPVVIDTCALSWAAPVHTLLTFAIAGAFGIWFIWWLISITLSVLNKKVTNPLADD